MHIVIAIETITRYTVYDVRGKEGKQMTRFSVQTEKEGNKKFFYILDQNKMEPELLSSQYLMHKIRSNRSPNTVRRSSIYIRNHRKDI